MTTITEPNLPSPTRNTPSSEVVIAVRGLTKVFKDFWGRPKARAVDGVDFEVRKGEVFGLLGPNGSGKSTTVKTLLASSTRPRATSRSSANHRVTSPPKRALVICRRNRISTATSTRTRRWISLETSFISRTMSAASAASSCSTW